MKQALENAIYYIHGNDDTYLKYHIISEFVCDNINEFKDTIESFKHDIQIRNLFGNSNNVCYDICENIAHYHNTLLLDQLDLLLIVTRKDNAIKISRTNIEKYSINIGIVKIDSVLAELNLSGLNSNYGGWYKYPLCLAGALGLLTLYYKADIYHE